jgi:Ni,Fe-hydrogenase III small subunit
VTGALTADMTLTVKDVTNSVDVGSITIASGTSPTNGKIEDDLTISSGSWSDSTEVQVFVECEDNWVGGVHVEAFYDLNPS